VIIVDPDLSIAILCPGPSLVEFLGRPRAHDAFIGVNRAATAWPCDFWAFNDHEGFNWYHGQVQRNGEKPVCFTSNQAYELLAGLPAIDEFRWLFYPQIETECPSDPGWTNYSLTIAMVLAEYVIRRRRSENAGEAGDSSLPPKARFAVANSTHHSSLFIYGCDWSGTADWDGAESNRGEGRTEYRWKNEQHKFWHVMRWLNGRDIDVIRVGRT